VDPIQDALHRAERAAFTASPPVGAPARMRLLVAAEKGSTRAVAARLGISQRQVERYTQGKAKHPRPALAAALDREVPRVWQPRNRARARARAAAAGLVVDIRAQLGYDAPVGTSDDPRMRRLPPLHLPPHYAAPLITAFQDGASDDELRDILAGALQDVYFQDRGRRALNLKVEINNIDLLEIQFSR
jgi:transcriptional regulator with XRE-family HTH domain